jgi:hypothetical protein
VPVFLTKSEGVVYIKGFLSPASEYCSSPTSNLTPSFLGNCEILRAMVGFFILDGKNALKQIKNNP